MSLTLGALVLGQLAVVAVVGMTVGDWIVGTLERRGAVTEKELGPPERALLALLGIVAVSAAGMAVHIATMGAVFENSFVVPVGAAVLVVFRWRRVAWRRFVPSRAALLFGVAVAALWLAPVLATGTAAKSGDIPWHMGWTEQILGGDVVPTGPAPAELAENSYPWGFHSLLATVTRLVPGGDVSAALITLDIVFVAALPLAAACLVRRVKRHAGMGAAAAVSLIGGFGWVLGRGSRFITSPSNAEYGADLVIASPNAVYSLFPPPLPREFGMVLLACAGMFLLLEKGGRDARIAGGVALGLTGLMSVPAFAAGLGWAIVSTFWVDRGRRLRALAQVLVPAGALFAVWTTPVVINAVMHGGLVNVSPQLGREWGVVSALGAWGLLMPAAVAGAWLAGRGPAGRRLLWLLSVVVVMLSLSLLRGVLDWALAGNATVLHQGRVWPIAHLVAAVLGGLAITDLWANAGRVVRASLCVAAAVGAVSPLLASVSLEGTIARGSGGFEYAQTGLEEGSFVRRVADRLGPEDVVLVTSADPDRDRAAVRDLSFHLFSFSGARLAAYDDPRLESNDLRIRYVDLAAAWDERVARPGFAETFRLVPRGDRFPGILDQGWFAGREWALLRGQGE